MKLYYIDPSKNYLKELALFLVENHMNDLENIEIFLPTRRACRSLEQEFFSLLSKRFNLKIFQIAEYDDSGEQIESFGNLKLIPKLEQKRVITNIIHSYKPLGFTIYQAASLSSSLILLFNQIDSEQIGIEKFTDISVDDSAEHWIKILNFLTYSYKAFKDYLKKTNQIDYPTLRNEKLKKYHYLDKPKYPIVIAGSSGSIKAVRNLIKSLVIHDNCYAVLPAMNLKDEIQDAEISPFHHIKKLIEFCDADCVPLGASEVASSLKNIKYFPTENRLEEARLISHLVRDISTKDPLAKIAIVTHNENLVSNIELYLKKSNLKIDNSLGYELKNTDFVTFAMLLAKMVLYDFVPIDILAVLKHKFLICNHVFSVEKQLFRGTEIHGGYRDLYHKFINIIDKEASMWFLNFLNQVESLVKLAEAKEINFSVFTRSLLNTSLILRGDILSDSDVDAEKFFYEFADAHNNCVYPKESYIFLLEKYISTVRYYPKLGWSSNVFAINPIEMRMLTFDYVIAADMNESSWPPNVPSDPWMNTKMREEVDLPLMQDNISKSFHDFYVLTQAKNLIITRAKKSDGAETSISRFIKSLLPDLTENSYYQEVIPMASESISVICNEAKISRSRKPKRLAVTHIELLIRNPYAFYARKILRLYPLDEIMKQPDFADFGNFIHKVFEKYSQDKRDIILLGKKILQDYNYSNFTKNLWWPKFLNIATEFVKFEEERAPKLEKICAEIEGKWNINISGDVLTLTAKADRIEVTKDHKINILDYKTGAAPSKKDVSLGLAPQLLIEQMIVEAAGFKEFSYRQVGELIYVKISASKPHIKEVCIEADHATIKAAMDGLQKLLKFYLDDDFVFASVPNKKYAPKYNDYGHLARK
jgi:ATP-dependent helicase/nuclease subunit B